MGIFSVHRQIVDDYASYIRSFVTIADDELRRRVEQHLMDGHLWPEPLLAFNPAFATVGPVETLAKSGVFAPQVADAFRGFKLFAHQMEAIRLGIAGTDFVVTSGTGSGKSLIYIGAIFEHLFRLGAPIPPGVTAVVVYPLNALVNSQEEELRRYAENYRLARGEAFPIRFAKFTGQEDIARRQELEAEPPHILLTNYMMLELLLTRGSQANLRAAVYDQLRFLVFDELHTYRGRQGADVGLLIRRIRAKAKLPVVCIGTSATMVSVGTLAEQKQQVAKVAEQFFGKPFSPEAVVQETRVHPHALRAAFNYDCVNGKRQNAAKGASVSELAAGMTPRKPFPKLDQAKSVLIVDDVFADGDTAAAVVQKLWEGGLNRQASILLAVPLRVMQSECETKYDFNGVLGLGNGKRE
jgi:ATP-dependent helicase YprA (DUF1998 family)